MSPEAPETEPRQPQTPPGAETPLAGVSPVNLAPESSGAAPDEWKYRGLRWFFFGGQGLRAGWSATIFCLLVVLFTFALDFPLLKLHLVSKKEEFTASVAFLSELAGFLALLAAAALLALVERRPSLLDYNLTGPRRLPHFLGGLAAGFIALSALVGALDWGGWLHFGPAALSGAEIFKFGALWAAAFLLVGCFEEGTFRCYLLFTLARGINFWWALGANALLCGDLLLRAKGLGVWGVYAAALIGLFPCLYLDLSKTPRSGFWQAAWVTSTLFGYVHTSNHGEDWIGIFAAALIGFVFCVSVRLTGSAWWAIGCHAAWDWAETFFYGAADSGMPSQGHYLSTHLAGSALWSGGTDGPEGSILVLGVLVLLLLALLAIYGRGKPAAQAVPAAE